MPDHLEDYDRDAEMIARLMQEEEDALKAAELQNDYYSGNRPPTAVQSSGVPSIGSRHPPMQHQEPAYERLIPDSRQELYDDWQMDEHVPARS